MRAKLLRSLARRFAGTALLFSGVVGVGTSLVLLFTSCLGYLPYSDRPGPGWWGRAHWPAWAEIAFYIGFSPWFAYFCIWYGLALFVLSVVLSIAATPRWLNRLLGGVIAAAAAGLAVLGAGWYFALANIGPDAAAILGLLYGVFLFPYFVQVRTQPLKMWVRISIVSCSAAIFMYWIGSPYLPRKPIPDVSYDFRRVTSGAKPVVAYPHTNPGVSNELANFRLRGDTHLGVSGLVGSGRGGPRIEVELITLEPITKRARLALPEAGYVLYVLKSGVWTAHPSIVRRDGRTLTIEPGTDPLYDGGQVKLGAETKFTPFTWFPVIPKGQ